MKLDLEAIEARCEAARRELNRLCLSQKKWTMSIPVREDDSDITLANSLRDVPALIAEIEQLLNVIEQLRAEIT